MRNTCKKAVWSGATLLCGLLVLSSPAQSEVYSVNVVGFQKLTAVSNTLTMVSTPFSRTTGSVNAVIGPQLTGGKTDGSADLILIWNATSQAYVRCWLKSSDTNWYVGASLATNVFISPEDGLFIQSRRATNQIVVVSGDVPDGDVATNALIPGLNLVSYPFSTSVDINKSSLTNGKSGKTDGSADLIIIWNSQTKAYDRYWLKTDRKWYSGAVVASNIFVGGGAGFWYQNRTNVVFNWVEPRPYTF